MNVFQAPLILQNVVRPKHIRPKSDFSIMLEFSQHFDYRDEFYQIGPDVLAITPQENEPDYVEYEFLLSLNLPPEIPKGLKGLKAYDKYMIEKALISRFADNQEDYFEYDKRLRDYAAKHFDLTLAKKTYFVVTDSFGEKIVDVHIPIERGSLV